MERKIRTNSVWSQCPTCGEKMKYGTCLQCSRKEEERLLKALKHTLNESQIWIFERWRQADNRFTSAIIRD